MANIENNQYNPNKKSWVTKRAKKSTSVDLTPMVDLGFLLITFFIFATTIAQPRVTHLRVPLDDIRTMPVNIDKTIIIMADSLQQYYSYEPTVNNSIHIKKHPRIEGVRKDIIAKKMQLKKNDLSVIIKIHPDAKYHNLIEMLDEMKINDISFYVMDKITIAETNKMDKIRKVGFE